jgi:hypothetical protein
MLRGHLAGPAPPKGIPVALLVRYHGRWEPFRAPRADGEDDSLRATSSRAP